MFNFHRLDVYRCSITFLTSAVPLADRAPRGLHMLSDQLRRAALSIPLNIAEGSGRFQGDERRYFLIARGSALECAAILDAFEAVGAIASGELAETRELLVRIVSMLTKLCRSEGVAQTPTSTATSSANANANANANDEPERG